MHCARARAKTLPDKRKPVVRRGRKATGQAKGLTAGLPKEGGMTAHDHGGLRAMGDTLWGGSGVADRPALVCWLSSRSRAVCKRRTPSPLSSPRRGSTIRTALPAPASSAGCPLQRRSRPWPTFRPDLPGTSTRRSVRAPRTVTAQWRLTPAVSLHTRRRCARRLPWTRSR